MRKFFPFTLYFMYFVAFAFTGPFTVLYYQSIGFTGTQIGLLAGITPLVNLVAAPFLTGLADSTRRHRLLMSLAMLAGTVTMFTLPFLRTFLPVMVLILFYTFLFAPASAFADSATMLMLGDKRDMYGRIRMGGTIGFGLAASVAGVLVQHYGLPVAFWGGSAAFFLCFIVSQGMLYNRSQDSVSVMRGVRSLLTHPRWVLFLVAAFAGGIAIAATNNYLFSYLKELGTDESVMGYALAAGTVIEIPVMFFGNRLIQRFKPYPLFLIGMFITGVRLILFGAIASSGFVLLLQLLNGFTFPVIWMAGVAYAHGNAPPGLSATAQGLFSAMVFGFGVAVGGFIGGLLLESAGGRVLYLVLGGIVLTTILIVALLSTRLPAEPSTEQASLPVA
jgi:PPP family 3-phenylpropionic acid transporter